MDAGIVDENLQRSVLQQFLHCRTRGIRVGQVKMNRDRLAAGGHYLTDDLAARRSAARRRHIQEVPGDAAPRAEARTNPAAAARHQGPSPFFHVLIRSPIFNRSWASKTTVARPLKSR